MARPKTYQISLTDEEVKQLKSVIRKKETNRTIKCRRQILLALDEVHGKVYSNAPCRSVSAKARSIMSSDTIWKAA